MSTLNKLISIISAILLAFCLLSGCRSGRYDTEPDSMLDRNWGRAFEAAKYNQMANPDAPENLEPPSGIDGAAADGALEKYRSGFKGKAAPEVYNLNLDVGGIAK